MFSQCYICVANNNSLHSLHETDPEGTSWQQKLSTITSETKLSSTIKLCKICCDEIDRLLIFRRKCIQALQRIQIEEYTCNHCDKTFKQETSLLRHITRSHKGESTDSDSTISDVFTTEIETLSDNNETRKSAKQTEFICQTCSNVFRSKYLLKRHISNVHAAEKRFSCDECDQRFVSDPYLQAHKKYHSKVRPCVCPTCGKRFYTMTDLNHHEKIHANKRAYRCDVCPKSFNTASDRTKHLKCVHSDPSKWPHACAICARKFPIAGNRDAHERTHSAARTHCCHFCGRNYSSAFTLRRHIETHSNETRFKCSECDTEYKNSRSLTLHNLKKHMKQKTLSNMNSSSTQKSTNNCHLCSKSFVAKSKLDKHMCSHSGDRPFPCQLCDKSFIDKSYVKQHMKLAHELT